MTVKEEFSGGTDTVSSSSGVRRSDLLPSKPVNPGSREAKAQGCTCAVLDNNHGISPPWPPDGWWVTEGCPVHDRGKVAVIQKVLFDGK